MKTSERAGVMVVMALAALLALAAPSDAQRHDHRASPFDAVRWSDDVPEIEVDGEWYVFESLDGTSLDDILAEIDRRWPGQRAKRFSEDLMDALATLGVMAGDTVTLVGRQVSNGARVTLEGVANTFEKRQALRRSSSPRRSTPPAPTALARDLALEDVRAFASEFAARFAYLEWRGIDFQSSVQQLIDTLEALDTGDSVDADDLAAALTTIVAPFGDGHASVHSPAMTGEGELPVLLHQSGDAVVVTTADRSAFLDPDRPRLVAIDGLDLERWLDAQRPFVNAGSEQYVRRQSMRALRSINTARRRSGLSRSPSVTLTLAAWNDRDDIRDVTLAVTARRPSAGDWPAVSPAIITTDAGTIGTLRIPAMDSDAVSTMFAELSELSDCDALIIDVRDNGGGSRAHLLALAPFFIAPDAPPLVANVAAYRLHPDHDDDHLAARFMVRADDASLTNAQRGAIKRAADAFTPEWQPPAERFSDWHYLVLDRSDYTPFLDVPVAVLTDAGCFSATDIFVGALTEFDAVEIIGAPTGGGSARSQTFALPNSRIAIRSATMASFRPNGWMYDGRGIEVDVSVEATPSYHLVDPATGQPQDDAVHRTAVERLAERLSQK